MSIDNYCMLGVSTDYSVCTQNYQPVKCSEPTDSVFKEIFEEKVNEADSQQQTCSAVPYFPPSIHSAPAPPAPEASVPAPSVSEAPAPTPPVSETPAPTPPVAAASVAESTGASYVDQYYPISEADVIPKIREVRHIINNTDLSGKTDVEKYEFLENRFIDAFGKDFMMARNLNLPSSMFYMIGVEYIDTLGKHIENPEQTNRIRLYGDVSAENVQNSIREKYPEELTNRDLFMMVSDMRNAGVLDSNSIRSVGVSGAQRIMDTMALLRAYSRHNVLENNGALKQMSLAERDKQWVSKLNERVANGDLLLLYNIWNDSGRVSMGQDTAPFLVNNAGGILGDDGRFILPFKYHTDHCWENMYAVMMAEMEEYDELIRSRLREIDAEVYTGAGENIVIGDDIGAGEDLGMGESSGVEESIVIGENPETEESTDSEDTGESSSDDVPESNPAAA